MWNPAIGRVYRLKPWEMERLTLREWDAIVKDSRDMDREARKAARSQ